MNGSSSTEIIDEVSKWTVGGGILLVALAPLSLPILILTAVAVVPLVLPVLGVALAVALFAVPLLLIRGLGRRVVGGLRRPRNAGQGRGPVPSVTGRLEISSRR